MAIGSHTIPRFYLEQFAVPRKNKPGRVCVYQKGTTAQPRSTKSQGRENGYFQIDREDGTKGESTETALAQFEDECLEALVSAKYSMCDLALVYVQKFDEILLADVQKKTGAAFERAAQTEREASQENDRAAQAEQQAQQENERAAKALEAAEAARKEAEGFQLQIAQANERAD